MFVVKRALFGAVQIGIEKPLRKPPRDEVFEECFLMRLSSNHHEA